MRKNPCLNEKWRNGKSLIWANMAFWGLEVKVKSIYQRHDGCNNPFLRRELGFLGSEDWGTEKGLGERLVTREKEGFLEEERE